MGLVCLLLNSALKFDYEMGPTPTSPPLSFGYWFCSCGSGPISHYNPGLMISPSLSSRLCLELCVSLSQPVRHTYSSLSQPSGHKAHTGQGVTPTSLSPTPVPCAGAGRDAGFIALDQQIEPAPLEAGRSHQLSVVQGRHLPSSVPACSYKEGQDQGTEGVIRASMCPRISDYFSVSWWILLATII